MRAVVLGASGHVGNAFVRELLRRGHTVTATSRQPQPSVNLTGLPVEYRVGDCERRACLDEWLPGHDLVIDAAAPYAFWLGDQPSPARAENLAATRMARLLDCARRHCAYLVHVGSFTTLARARSAFDAAQGALLRRIHPYFELKRVMQECVLAACRNDLQTLVVNPTLCLGPFDLKAPHFCMIPVALKGELPAVNNHPINVIDVRDVAAATLNAVEAEHFGEALPLTGHNSSIDSLVGTICRIGGVDAPRIQVPASLPAVAAWSNEILSRVGLSPFEYPSLGMLLLLEQCWMPTPAIRRELLPELRPLSRSIAEAIDWYRDVGHLDRPSSETLGRRAS